MKFIIQVESEKLSAEVFFNDAGKPEVNVTEIESCSYKDWLLFNAAINRAVDMLSK